MISENASRTAHRQRVAQASYQIFEFLPVPPISLVVSARIDTQPLCYGLIGVRKINGKCVSI